MHARGTIEGRLLLPDGAPIGRIELHVVRAGGAPGGAGDQVFGDGVASDGRFRWTGLTP
jgi:hypothetical protein